MSTPSSDIPSSDVLAAHGWDAHWARLAGGAPAGRVTRVDRGLVDVVTATGPVRVRAADAAVGDWVLLPAQVDRPATVLPRRTLLARAAASGRSEAQVLAANVDTVVVAVAQDTGLRPGRTERLPALAWESGAVPVVVLTKADHDPGAVADALAELAVAAPGVEVLAVSSRTGAGLDGLRALAHGTVVLVGPSGAGKSTLANALLGEDRLAVGAVRARDGKGRHTTAHRELVALPGGGVLVDTPGLRGVGLADAAEGMERAFADVVALASDCRFGDCAHDREPGCAVRAAVESGDLPARRLGNYHRLRREERWAAARTDARLAGERKDQARALSRAQRAMYRDQGRR